MTFAVLFVCTGNICRSPMAERLFTARLKPGQNVAVTSAGTHAVVGHGMDAPSALVLRELGGDPDGHVARQLDDALVRDADLILTATAGQRAVILQAEPAALRRTFTLREFARLGGELPARRPSPSVEPVRRRIAEVAAQRGVAAQGEDDIADPFGGTLDDARRAGEQVDAAVDAALRVLGLAR